ncbi:MAG: hypothetical protein HRU51_01790 [Xanthomonadales bacterium]|nr:hypothetical protein [Xanthomonadales bacterium]
MNMQIHHLYTVPLIEFVHPDREQLCPSLRAFFLAREQIQYKDDIERDTQLGEVFESRFDLFYWKDPELQPLVQFVHGALARTVMELNAYEPAFMERLRFDYHAWYHITRSGGFQGVHNHPNASWSGIFCVDPGAPGKDAREGTVRFYDPRANADYYTDPGNQNLQAPFRNGGTEVRHEPGKLWLFPSYLLHEVFPYFGHTPRIVVAFNCWLGADQKPRRSS